MEIGDTFEIDEAESEETSTRSPGAGKAPRRKNGRNGNKGRNGRQSGGGDGDGNGDVPILASGGRVREIDLRRLLAAMRDLRDGDFDVRLPIAEEPLLAEIADAFNGIAKLNESLAQEMIRVSTTIGREGEMTERASLGPVTGGWRTTVTLHQLADHRPRPADVRSRPRDHRGRRGRPDRRRWCSRSTASRCRASSSASEPP